VVELSAQENEKKKIEQEMQQFNRQYEADFQNFKRRREDELRKMEQEYQDFYNSMLGLKRYYQQNKDTSKVNIIDGVINYEKKIAQATGKSLKETQKVEITPEILQTKYGQSIAQSETYSKPEAAPATQPNQRIEPKPGNEKPKASESAETTLKPLSDEIDVVPCQTPVPHDEAIITSAFGYRIHPILRIPKFHTGIDFGSRMNTPVIAAANGKVVLYEHNSTYGHYVVVQHSNDYSSVYAHLDKTTVSVGKELKKGDLIGYCGKTGRATGPHLHYEVRLKGTPIDPKGYLSYFK